MLEEGAAVVYCGKPKLGVFVWRAPRTFVVGHKNEVPPNAWILAELRCQPEYSCLGTLTWKWDLACVFSQREFSPCPSLLVAEGL